MLILNTTYAPDGHGGGSIARHQMAQMKPLLAVDSGRSVCVFMRHHAVPVDSLWQDDIMLGNAQEFTHLIASKPEVKAVICGHMHQKRDHFVGATRFLATPSSAVQFACQQSKIKVHRGIRPCS